jgi:predicted Fe-S protein YdhL (DUF1289 family)
MTTSTPCIGICVMDSGLCIGCGRTLDEIARWGALSEAERHAIMAVLPGRRPAERKAQENVQADQPASR